MEVLIERTQYRPRRQTEVASKGTKATLSSSSAQSSRQMGRPWMTETMNRTSKITVNQQPSKQAGKTKLGTSDTAQSCKAQATIPSLNMLAKNQRWIKVSLVEKSSAKRTLSEITLTWMESFFNKTASRERLPGSTLHRATWYRTTAAIPRSRTKPRNKPAAWWGKDRGRGT